MWRQWLRALGFWVWPLGFQGRLGAFWLKWRELEGYPSNLEGWKSTPLVATPRPCWGILAIRGLEGSAPVIGILRLYIKRDSCLWVWVQGSGFSYLSDPHLLPSSPLISLFLNDSAGLHLEG